MDSTLNITLNEIIPLIHRAAQLYTTTIQGPATRKDEHTQ